MDRRRQSCRLFVSITDLDPLEHETHFDAISESGPHQYAGYRCGLLHQRPREVFKYVVERYGGGEYVAQIITFGKLKTRAVIRDVGRALDIPLQEVDTIAKLVPDVLNIKLSDALKQEPRLRELQETRPDVDELIRICLVLKDCRGTHPPTRQAWLSATSRWWNTCLCIKEKEVKSSPSSI